MNTISSVLSISRVISILQGCLVFIIMITPGHSFAGTAPNQNTVISTSTSNYRIRPFVSSQDEAVLLEICKDVWNGTDYLPSRARDFEADESCDFCVMENEDGEVVAVGNSRLYQITNGNKESKEKIAWIESIRTSTKHRGKGIATRLLEAFINRAKQNNITRIMSCTVDDNFPMLKVFDRVDMELKNNMYYSDFEVLKTLPGWGSKSSDVSQPQSLLTALNLEHLVEESTRSIQWSTIKSEAELNDALTDMKKAGGLGHLPGMGKMYFFDCNVKESLEKGLIRKIERKENGSNKTSCIAIYCFSRDTSIQSLKSKWVCSIVASESVSFESALWDACSDSMIAKRDGDVAFVPVYDGCLSKDSVSKSAFMSALPIQRKRSFVIYSHN